MREHSEKIVAQRDYVRRGQSAPPRRKKKNNIRSKQRSSLAVSPTMVAIAAAVLVAFIGGLYFITHYKKEEHEALSDHKAVGNGLPPKPEERWRYIKELESRQPGVRAPTEPTAGGEVKDKTQLTDEQRQLLAQMQADMRQQPTQLSEVPWDEQTPQQRRQTLAHQRQVQQQDKDTQPPQTQAPVHNVTRPVEAPLSQRTGSINRNAETRATYNQPYQETQTPVHSAPKPPPVKTATAEPSAAKETASASKDDRRWLIQCGSFRAAEQAGKVSAELALSGFDTRVTSNNGLNRVVIGPLKGKENADNTLSRLKATGHSCFRLAAGG